MEKRYFYKNRNSKLFIWLASIVFTLYIINSLLPDDEGGLSNSFYLIFLGLAFLIQYLLYKQWYVKLGSDSIFIRKNNLLTKKEIPFSKIVGQRLIVTGDLEISLKNEKINILKDLLKEEDFQEIQNKINSVIQ